MTHAAKILADSISPDGVREQASERELLGLKQDPR